MPLKTTAGGATHRGLKRKLNEDAILVRPDLGLFLVADGVGGQNAGEVASALASRSIENFFEATEGGRDWPDEYRALLDLALPPGARRLSAAVRKANRDVHSVASTHRAHRQMKSTIVSAHLPAGTHALHVAHVGDSRCYRIRGGDIELLTSDHSLRNLARLEHPEIDAELIDQIPDNVLSRALGQSDAVEIDIASHTLVPGDRYLLCSDGLNRMLDDRAILEVVDGIEAPREACRELVRRANRAGGRDNVTALIIRVD